MAERTNERTRPTNCNKCNGIMNKNVGHYPRTTTRLVRPAVVVARRDDAAIKGHAKNNTIFHLLNCVIPDLERSFDFFFTHIITN